MQMERHVGGGLRFGMGFACGIGLALGTTLASAQGMDEEPATPRSSIAEPTPLISVLPGPAVPAAATVADPATFPALPARYADPIGPFTMFMEIIATGPSEYGLFTAPGCVLDGIFKRGMKLVWRFEVYDMDSRLRLTDGDRPQVDILLSDGTVFPAHFEPRGMPGRIAPDAPWTWVVAWHIPLDYSLGPVDYAVRVRTADGRSATIQPSTWGANYPRIID